MTVAANIRLRVGVCNEIFISDQMLYQENRYALLDDGDASSAVSSPSSSSSDAPPSR
jgi:hypothetical protein